MIGFGKRFTRTKPYLSCFLFSVSVTSHLRSFSQSFLKVIPRSTDCALRDLDKKWYLDGFGDVSGTVEQTAKFIYEKTKGYERVIFSGSSVGGKAAILFGEIEIFAEGLAND
jgi:hypothetical protein